MLEPRLLSMVVEAIYLVDTVVILGFYVTLFCVHPVQAGSTWDPRPFFLKFKSESKQNRTHQHGIDRRAKISLTMTKMTPWQLPIYIPPPPPIPLPVDLRPNDRKLRSCVFCPSSSVACTFYSTRIVEPDSAECKLCGSIRPNLPHGV